MNYGLMILVAVTSWYAGYCHGLVKGYKRGQSDGYDEALITHTDPD